MFTGIVEGTATVAQLQQGADGARLRLQFPPDAEGWRMGQSIAINGTCLTVAEIEGDTLFFDLAGETLRRTNLGALAGGARVNFERALRLGERLDGHLVQGHVDGTGVVRDLRRVGEDTWLEIAAAPELLKGMISQGSVTVDGVSLTVAHLGSDHLRITLVPHTLEVTNLGDRREGDRVNLETDVVGKWIARQMVAGSGPD